MLGFDLRVRFARARPGQLGSVTRTAILPLMSCERDCGMSQLNSKAANAAWTGRMRRRPRPTAQLTSLALERLAFPLTDMFPIMSNPVSKEPTSRYQFPRAHSYEDSILSVTALIPAGRSLATTKGTKCREDWRIRMDICPADRCWEVTHWGGLRSWLQHPERIESPAGALLAGRNPARSAKLVGVNKAILAIVTIASCLRATRSEQSELQS